MDHGYGSGKNGDTPRESPDDNVTPPLVYILDFTEFRLELVND